MRHVLLLLAFVIALPAHADIQFHPRITTGAKIPRGKGQCEIRLIVDRQVDVSLRGDTIGVRTLTGADARDSGSECSAPLPAREVEGFTFAVKKRHGEVSLVEGPSARNNFTATFFIHGNAGGDGLYDVRISWTEPSAAPPGMSMNIAIHFAARGAGKAALNDAAPVSLGDVSVDIDRGNKIMVTFQVGRSGSAILTGTVMSWEGGVLKMDAAADEQFHRLPGPLYLYFDARKQIYKAAMDATNGQEQLRVAWQRK